MVVSVAFVMALCFAHINGFEFIIKNEGAPSTFEVERTVIFNNTGPYLPTPFFSHELGSPERLYVTTPKGNYIGVALYEQDSFLLETRPFGEGQIWEVTVDDVNRDFKLNLSSDVLTGVFSKSVGFIFSPFLVTKFAIYAGMMWREVSHDNYYWVGRAKVFPNTLAIVTPTSKFHVTTQTTTLAGCTFDFDKEGQNTGEVIYTSTGTWKCQSY